MSNFFKSVGYGTHREKVEKRLDEARVDLSAEKPKDLSSNAPDIFAAEEQQPADPIYPTDLMNTPVQNPTITPAPKLDVNKTVTQAPQNPQTIREDQNAAVNTYVQMDKQIKAEFIAELEEVDPEVGKAVGDMLHSREDSGFMMAVSLADDVVAPGATAVWAAIDAIVGDANNPNSKRVQDAIAKTLENLQTKTTEQAAQASKGNAPQPQINWNNVKTPQQIQEFLTRDIEQDPFMQQAARNDLMIGQMEDNFQKYNEVYLQGRQNVTADMVATAASAGDRELVAALVGGDENRINAANEGRTVDAVREPVAPTAEYALTFSRALDDILGVNPNPESVDTVHKGAQGAAGALNLESQAQRAAAKARPDYAFT